MVLSVSTQDGVGVISILSILSSRIKLMNVPAMGEQPSANKFPLAFVSTYEHRQEQPVSSC